MNTKKTAFVICFGLLVACVVFAQYRGDRVLVEKKAVKIIGAENFPSNLDCEIYIGADRDPHFRTEGTNGQIKSAFIEANLSTSVSLVRRETDKESFALFLFSEDKEGKVLGFFDLNMDGQWDVKKTPTRNEKNFIKGVGSHLL